VKIICCGSAPVGVQELDDPMTRPLASTTTRLHCVGPYDCCVPYPLSYPSICCWPVL